jgi:peptidoglycan-associated lipoprotein
MRLPGPKPRPSRDATAILAVLALGVATMLAGCPDKKPKGPTCAGDADCKDGLRCIEQQCRACAEDAHCKEWEHCAAGACVLDEGACDTRADCPNDEACVDHKCTPCESDLQCGEDARCQDGRCLTRGACTKNEDCADDEDCIDGQCKRPGRDGSAAACSLALVYFGFDARGLDDVARTTLEADASCLRQVDGRGVMLVGHTDPRGTEEYNIALSEDRAQTVGDYLSRLGIDPARFHFIPKGETEAVGTEDATWAKDRRVELEWQ